MSRNQQQYQKHYPQQSRGQGVGRGGIAAAAAARAEIDDVNMQQEGEEDG